MNHSKAIFLFSDAARAIHVDYEGSERNPQRILAKTMDPNVKAGDFVIVPTDTRHKMTVVKVIAVDVEYDIESPEAVNWVIGVINPADYQDIVAKEQQAISLLRAAEQQATRKKYQEMMFANAGDAGLRDKLGKIIDAQALPAPKASA